MEYKIFYACNETGDSVESSEPYQTDKDTALSIAQQVLRDRGDFFGIKDENDITLQMMVEEDGQIWLEIPVPAKQGSYVKRIQASELESEFLKIEPPFNPSKTPGLEFSAW